MDIETHRDLFIMKIQMKFGLMNMDPEEEMK